uniref:Uncharacterized protein n=1 Tax=Romanomermis culicivorax TaxID=13658 RepID=A0A915HGS9_ROMCU
MRYKIKFKLSSLYTTNPKNHHHDRATMVHLVVAHQKMEAGHSSFDQRQKLMMFHPTNCRNVKAADYSTKFPMNWAIDDDDPRNDCR